MAQFYCWTRINIGIILNVLLLWLVINSVFVESSESDGGWHKNASNPHRNASHQGQQLQQQSAPKPEKNVAAASNAQMNASSPQTNVTNVSPQTVASNLRAETSGPQIYVSNPQFLINSSSQQTNAFNPQINSSNPQRDNSSPTVNSSSVDISECGVKGGKSCWLMPGQCNDTTSCHSIVTWRGASVGSTPAGGGDLILEFDTRIDDIVDMPNSGKYAALGFSDDYQMGNDFVFECVANPSGRVQAYVSYNDGTMNMRNRQASKVLLHNTTGRVENGRLYCQTTYSTGKDMLKSIPAEEKPRILDISSGSYYLLFARGSADAETDALHMHYLMDGDLFPWISTDKVDVMNREKAETVRAAKHYDIPRSMQYDMVKAHGVMMIAGWWIFAATGMLLARNFKSTWPDSKLCGSPVWFQLHRLLMIISLTIICAAFALIFVEKGTLITCSGSCSNDNDYNLMLHAYMGIACTAAAFIQPFMALLRPSPTSPKRPIFAWLHWFVGMGAFVTATITMFLSTKLGKAGLKRAFKRDPDYVMAGYVGLFVLCNILFELLWYIPLRRLAPARIQLSSLHGPKVPVPVEVTDVTEKTSHHATRTVILIFFVIAAGALCATLSYFIVSNHH